MKQQVRPAVNESSPGNWSCEIKALGSTYEVFKFLRQTAEEFGFAKFSVVEVPFEDVQLAAVSIVNNWDPEFVAAYDELELAKNSPIFQYVRESTLPRLFDVQKIQSDRPTDQRRAAMELFNSFAKTKGLIVPVHSSSGIRGAVSFTGDELTVNDEDIHQLHVRSLHIFEKLILLRDGDQLRRPELTKREIECLDWTSQGKTSGEIATILDVSVNSVNHHINSLCRKLGATNRVRAVATAIRMRLIA